jgi:Tat protein translocase TatB subunit
MFDVGFSELVLLFVIGLLVLGPQRLPKVAAEIGKWVGRARRTATQLRRQLEREIELADLEEPPTKPKPPPPAASPPPADTASPADGAPHPDATIHADATTDASPAATPESPPPPVIADVPQPQPQPQPEAERTPHT